MAKYEYKVKGVDYVVEIQDIEGNIANVTVNGIPFEVEMKQPVKSSKQKVKLSEERRVKSEEFNSSSSATNASSATTTKPAAAAANSCCRQTSCCPSAWHYQRNQGESR